MVFPTSPLSGENVLRDIHDPANQNIRVSTDIEVSSITATDITIRDATISSQKLTVNADGSIDANVVVDAAGGDNIAISDGTNILEVNADGSINVNVPVVGLAPAQFDEVQIARNLSGDPTQYNFYYLAGFVSKIDVIYDINNNVIGYKK